MEIRTIVNENNEAVMKVFGKIDTDSSAKFQQELMKLDFDDLDLTLDFNEVTYITSAALRVLLIVRKRLSDETMRIINVSSEVADVLKVTGFSDFLRYTEKKTYSEHAFELSFKALLKEKVQSRGDSVAFVYRDREYTWNDIDKASQIIANDLSAVGVKKGSHVGICSSNSINWIYAFYAIQKLGGLAILVNFSLMPHEVALLSEIGDIEYLCYGNIVGVTDYDEYISELNDLGSRVKVTYDIRNSVDFSERFCEYDDIKNRFPEIYDSDDPSIVIFTSGSTGRPKGVLSSSHNALECIVPLIDEIKITKDDRNCAFLPFFHIFGFAVAIAGGILSDDVSYIPATNSPGEILGIIEKYRCTMFNTVPTMLLAMIKTPDFSPEKVKSLRVSYLGGSATTEAQMKMLQEIFPNNHFGNIYGMSENSVISITTYNDTVEHITQTVGKPAKGVEIEIRNPETGEKLPDGEVGEITIRSEFMIVCYYKLSIDKQPLDDEGFLATGDLGYIDKDGYIRLSGRVKDLIIRGGENISPGEVAEAISKLPGIADVKVIGVPDDVFGEEVAAAVKTAGGASFDEAAAKETLRKYLAKFKIPKYFFVMDSFPVLGSGKVDTAALRKQISAMISDK